MDSRLDQEDENKVRPVERVATAQPKVSFGRSSDIWKEQDDTTRRKYFEFDHQVPKRKQSIKHAIFGKLSTPSLQLEIDSKDLENLEALQYLILPTDEMLITRRQSSITPESSLT